MSSIVRRGGVWYAVYYINGSPVRLTTGVRVEPKRGEKGGMTARERKTLAQMTAAAMEAAARGEATVEAACQAVRVAAGKWGVPGRGGAAAAGRLTMDAWLEDALRELGDNGHGGGRQRRGNVLHSWRRLMPRWCDVPVRAVGEVQIREWVGLLHNELAANTVKYYIATMKRCFSAAVRRKIVDVSPAAEVEAPSAEDSHRREAFSAEEVQLMLATFPGEWPDMIRCCLLLGGQRLGDVADLRWDAVDFAGGCVKLRTQKTKREMFKPLIDPLRELLEVRLNRLESGCEWVFPEAHASERSKLSRDFVRRLRDHGILPPVAEDKNGASKRKKLNIKSFHSLRATAVTWLLNNNVPPEMVRYIVGHSNSEIERRHYYRPQMAEEARAMSQLAAGLLGSPPSAAGGGGGAQ